MIAAIGGGSRHAAVALADDGRIVGACSQERATRVRGAGLNASGAPDEALELLLQRHGRARRDIGRIVAVADDGPAAPPDAHRLDHHYAHACTAYLTSPFDASAIVVCDHEAPEVTVWTGEGARVDAVPWPWAGPGFSTAFARISRALGFGGGSTDQRVAALARLFPDGRDTAVDALMSSRAEGLEIADGLEAYVDAHRHPDALGTAPLAAALQSRLAELLIEFLGHVRARVGLSTVCLGGSFFYNTAINARVRESGVFARVFVPVDPGNSGLAVGAAQRALEGPPTLVSPFLGPSYTAEETKRVLDNCKLHYSWETEDNAIGIAVRELRQGRMVGWFDGGMEWGQRALGARCILASPTAPYVLDNLNRFLKQRDAWRGYAVSGLADAVATHFDGPGEAPFMECDYRPRDARQFREVLPAPLAAMRVQTVSETSTLPRFRHLLAAFGEGTGLPFLVNTSFNGFHEPMVCSPRDAVRVFYGTGLDVLILNQFVLRK